LSVTIALSVTASQNARVVVASTIRYQVLAPQAKKEIDSLAFMPFWTRKDGFNVISILVSPEKRLLIGR
jgi:hypothetical protein